MISLLEKKAKTCMRAGANSWCDVNVNIFRWAVAVAAVCGQGTTVAGTFHSTAAPFDWPSLVLLPRHQRL